jgi:hypothetical protein
MSDLTFRLDLHFLYAHLEVVRFKAMGSARPLNADAAKLCANFPDLLRRDINLPSSEWVLSCLRAWLQCSLRLAALFEVQVLGRFNQLDGRVLVRRK